MNIGKILIENIYKFYIRVCNIFIYSHTFIHLIHVRCMYLFIIKYNF